MNRRILVPLATGLAAAIFGIGCAGHRAVTTFQIPGGSSNVASTDKVSSTASTPPVGITDAPPIGDKPAITELTPPVAPAPGKDDKLALPEYLNGHPEDRAALQASTIHFDYDTATLKKADTKNLDAVAKYLKETPADAVLIEGNCDDRGTPEYNRALGERRALAAREYLIKKGKIAASRILTKSFGDQRPAAEGHDESARATNRRDEFVVLKPKTTDASNTEHAGVIL